MEYLLGALVVAVALFGAGHAVMYKREPRSAALWVLAIMLLPLIGTLLYGVFGVNRVERLAARLRGGRSRTRAAAAPGLALPASRFDTLARLMGAVSERPLLPGNAIAPLRDGREAYPAMLAAIEGASRSVALSSYIFHGDGIGARFVDALAAAARRGVAVRVLIDDVGARFAWPSAASRLRRSGVAVGVFNRTLVPARLHSVNLRNHRKILLVDGAVAFTGGMNVDRRYWGEGAFRDLHFRLQGPVVAQLLEVFAADWMVATGETLAGAPWSCEAAAAGEVLARTVDDGPDESFERLRWACIGGLNEARRSVRLCTPYFLPDATLISALNGASLRGVEVDIVLPQSSDLPHVQWAAMHHLWQVLERGCRVWLTPGPFDHGKLMVVDGEWTLFGSANWDARSMRLNFELGVECYGRELGASMEALLLERRERSRALTLAEVDARPFAVRLRDGIARLFTPLL